MLGFVKCFGTGPGKSDGRRAYSAYFFQLDQTGLMVDCGEPLSLSFKKAQGDVNGFDALLISHTHPDHIGGFLSFIQSLRHGERKKPLPVHLPAHAIPALTGLMRAAYIFPERLPFTLSFHKLRASKTFSIGPLRITPHPTAHLAPVGQKAKRHGIPLEAYSFVFEGDGWAVAHSGDIGSEQDLRPLLALPLIMLVVELAHAKPEKLFQLIAQSRVERTAFVHLKDSQWEQRAALKQQAAAILKRKKAFFPKDGQEIAF